VRRAGRVVCALHVGALARLERHLGRSCTDGDCVGRVVGARRGGFLFPILTYVFPAHVPYFVGCSASYSCSPVPAPTSGIEASSR
jgi:hypothetical protein